MRKIYRRAYVVIGGESTGTRMVTNLLVKGGCFGDSGHTQRIDGMIKEKRFTELKEIMDKQPVVIRRSLPHDSAWFNIRRELVDPFTEELGFSERDLYFLVTTRDWFCASRSAAIAGHSSTPYTALEKLREAYGRIGQFFLTFNACEYYTVAYEGIIHYPHFAVPIMYRQAELYVPITSTPMIIKDIVDNNRKHFVGFKRDAWEDEAEQTVQTS